MFRTLLAFALFAASLSLRAEDAAPAPALEGRIEGRTYVSPTGIFKVTIPVLPELGGQVTDTPNVVTFEDDFNIHISIAAFPQDATQRWNLTTKGIKDYLIYFFSSFVLADFKQTFEGAQTESAKFVPALLDGSLITYILIPGGTMFADKVPQLGISDQLPVAKRGNLLFVRNGHTFVISIELAEHAIQGKSYTKTKDEQDEILRQRLIDVVAKMQFAKPPASSPAAVPAPVPGPVTPTPAPAPAADAKK